jgi:peptide/nickel transport system permease protein
MRVVDALYSVPFILMAMVVVGVLGPSVLTVVATLGLVQWQNYARVVRAEVLTLREREYVMAARVVGQTNFKIAIRHVLPNAMASVIVLATLQVASTIISESALSFLGVGVQPPTVTWGLMLSDGRNYLATAWWLATFPGLAITITVLGIIFLGDWLRDVLDPRLRSVEG